MAIIYRFTRYHARDEIECGSLGDAFYAAFYDLEYQEAFPLAIERDGDVVREGQALVDEVHRLYADYYAGGRRFHTLPARSPA